MKSLFKISFCMFALTSTSLAQATNNDLTNTALLIPIDSNLQRFVEIVNDHYSGPLTKYDINQKILKAALMFDALGAYGLQYEPTAHKSDFFSKLAEEDTLYLIPPLEIFSESKGSAQELAITFAALLEANRIATALLNASEHPIVLFDTGIHKKYSEIFSDETVDYTIKNNHIWFAVEVTGVGGPFHEAWKKTFGKIQSRPMDLIPVMEVFDRRDDKLALMFKNKLEKRQISFLFQRDKDYFEDDDRIDKLKEVKRTMREDKSRSVRHLTDGIRYLKAGAHAAAVSEFKRAADYGADLGKVLFLMAKAFRDKRDYEKMKRTGLKLLQFNRRDPRGYKVLGLAYYYSGDLRIGQQFLSRAKFLEKNLLFAGK
ncbi:hypothetical protein GWO43_14150 [candidate division KSB1 bacterium]|nr:hypothetical protein [candidate division KSB1 bacterium]NIT71985.1 hypothetical protein [candidate division KSB1 bacterium]NIX71665.1 hypothetical protein [candidate division KSB1 bacterium]